jgi:4a-hydroxytetrahydrobiopterin dehydratase
MAELKKEKCTACQSGAPPVSESEKLELMKQLPDWKIKEVDGEPRLEREFKFPDFVSALSFTDRVAAAAENAGHHPAILLEWGKVKVSWWTHKIHNLHRNDFIMAATTDDIFGQ